MASVTMASTTTLTASVSVCVCLCVCVCVCVCLCVYVFVCVCLYMYISPQTAPVTPLVQLTRCVPRTQAGVFARTVTEEKGATSVPEDSIDSPTAYVSWGREEVGWGGKKV